MELVLPLTIRNMADSIQHLRVNVYIIVINNQIIHYTRNNTLTETKRIL